jgi:TonB family protein
MRSPAEGNSPPADRDGLPNDLAWGDAGQLLPIKRVEVIGVRSSAKAYPEVVAALTRPPGVTLASNPLKTLDSPVLPSAIAGEYATSPAVQVATSPLTLAEPAREETALRVGESLPSNRPAVVEALTHPPDLVDLAGGGAALPEVVAADEPSGPAVADAIVGTEPERPTVDQLAERIETPVPPTPQATASTDAPRPPATLGPAATDNARGGAPGPMAEAADPAPDTGLESDPFSKIPSVEFRNGKVAARSGRQIKPVRPRLSETAQRDLLGLQFPTILAKVRIDKTGKVTDVTVLRGSGSQTIDMPVYRALWNWWFEPPRDKKGNPLEDVQLVAIHWS